MGTNGLALAVDEIIRESTRQTLTALRLKGPNFKETPKRVAKFWLDFTNKPIPVWKTFPTNNNEMVIMRNHIVWGLCPHHLLPVRYKVKLAYLPDGEALGLSKLARLVDFMVSTLPIQEDLTQSIVNALDEKIKNKGVACQIEGEHLCMQMRGVKSQQASVVTTALKGMFFDVLATREEFLKS